MPAITQAEVDAYRRDGYVIVRSLLSPVEAERVARLTRLEPALATRKRNRNFADASEYESEHGVAAVETLLSSAEFKPGHDVVSAWASSRRLVEPLEAIWGGPVRHYYSILMPKDPGTGGWQWHQARSCHPTLACTLCWYLTAQLDLLTCMYVMLSTDSMLLIPAFLRNHAGV